MRADDVIVFDFALVGVCFLFLALRLYVRVGILRKFEASDALVCIAWLTFTGTSLSDVFSSRWGMWNPEIEYSDDGSLPDFEKYIPDPAVLRNALIVMYASTPFSQLVLYSVKFSFLLLYRQIFPPEMKRLWVALKVSFVVVAMIYLSTLGMDLLWCIPVSRNWTNNKSDRCINVAAVPRYLYVNLTNILTDILVYALPFFLLPALYRSRGCSRAKLAGVVGIMSVGLLSIMCSVGRIAATGSGASGYVASMWGTAEQGSAVLVACCPPLRYLLLGRKGQLGSQEMEEQAETKTAWRFWRMGAFVGRDAESTVDTFAREVKGTGTGTVSTITGGVVSTVSNHGGSLGDGGGLAPLPRRLASVNANVGPASKVATERGSQSLSRQDGRGSRTREKIKKKQMKRDTATGSSRASRSGGNTFGSTQYPENRGSDEGPRRSGPTEAQTPPQRQGKTLIVYSPTSDRGFSNTLGGNSRPASGIEPQ